MFDRLDDLLIRYEEVMGELQEPDVANDPERFRKLMKEQSDLAPIVEAYKEYKACNQNIEDSLAMLEEESDEEMKELAKEELNESKERVAELEQQLKILLLPKDPNDDKNVIVEIRAGAGGDEAALFAAEVYRMYVHYADKRGWKTMCVYDHRTGSILTSEIRERRAPGAESAGDRERRKDPYINHHCGDHARGGRSGCGDR